MRFNKLLSLVLAFVICLATPLTANSFKAFAGEASDAVAKVGNTEYASIDEAIANWTNNTTLTLLADVTLSDVIKLSSTEKHVLNLGTFTMTAASKMDAIQIVNNARGSAGSALEINADAENPGGIIATGKAIVRTSGKSGVKDRPMIYFKNGIFNASYIVYHTGSNGTNCPQFQFHDGVFNGTIYSNRALNQFYGGTFNGSLMMSVDSSAYTLVKGGRFKQLSNLYNSSLNSDKFTIGSAKGVYDRSIYVDDEGYYNVVPELPSNGSLEALVSETYNSSIYFYYSKAQTEGMGYTDFEAAMQKATSSTPVKAFVAPEVLNISKDLKLDFTEASFESALTINLTSTSVNTFTMTYSEATAPTEITVNAYSNMHEVTKSSVTNDGVVTYTVKQAKLPVIAKIGTAEYVSLAEAHDAATDGQTITLNANAEESSLVIEKDVTLDLNSKKLTLTQANAKAISSGLAIAEGKNVTIKNGTIEGSNGALIQNYANLTLENVTLENLTLENVTLDATAGGSALLSMAGETTISNSQILANEGSLAFEVNGDAKVALASTNVQGLIKLSEDANGEFNGNLTADGVVHSEPGDYVQFAANEEIVRLDEFKFDIDVDGKNEIKTGETIQAVISLDKAFYSAEYTFTYNTALFTCAEDADGDGVIYGIVFERDANAGFATFNLTAKNNIEKVEVAALTVTGNVVQYQEQILNQYVNVSEGEEETIKISLNYTVEIVADYVSGYSLVLVKGNDGGYALNSDNMFYVEAYEAYAIIVMGAIDEAGVDAGIAKATGCETIMPSFDVNCEFVKDGKVDLKDATIAYACTSTHFDVPSYMELYLRADVNADKHVNIVDVNAITANYNG